MTDKYIYIGNQGPFTPAEVFQKAGISSPIIKAVCECAKIELYKDIDKLADRLTSELALERYWRLMIKCINIGAHFNP